MVSLIVCSLCFSYNIVYFLLTYIVPIVAMGVCYSRIGSVLWGKGLEAEAACNDLAQERKLASKRKESAIARAAKLKMLLPSERGSCFRRRLTDFRGSPFLSFPCRGGVNPIIRRLRNARGKFPSICTRRSGSLETLSHPEYFMLPLARTTLERARFTKA
jgi:hypothetical protein